MSTVEGLPKEMKIYTMLPASLETEFMNEVKRWGDPMFQVSNNHWFFLPLDTFKKDITLRKKIVSLFGLNQSIIKQLVRQSKLKAQKLGFTDEIGEGVFLPLEYSPDGKYDVYTDTGEPYPGKGYSGVCSKLNPVEVILIEKEIDMLIQLKYNFIHYNGFPPVDKIKFDAKGKIIDETQGKALTRNQQLAQDLMKLYTVNKQTKQILSPFQQCAIIIDEVHNFVREIVNGVLLQICFTTGLFIVKM